jgi:hypothetical protein
VVSLREWTLGSSHSVCDVLAVSCEHGNERKISIKHRKFLDYLSDHTLLKKCSAPVLGVML